jgi:hypothetical protein
MEELAINSLHLSLRDQKSQNSGRWFGMIDSPILKNKYLGGSQEVPYRPTPPGDRAFGFVSWRDIECGASCSF